MSKEIITPLFLSHPPTPKTNIKIIYCENFRKLKIKCGFQINIFHKSFFNVPTYLDQKYLSCALCPPGDRNQKPFFPGGQLAGNQERLSLCINQRQTRINDVYSHA